MVTRIWHGWTTAENASVYEKLLRGEILPAIAARTIPGYRGVRLLKRQLPNSEVEFITLMEFDSLDDVKGFVGDDYERAHVPEKARRVLARYDARVHHYETIPDP